MAIGAAVIAILIIAAAVIGHVWYSKRPPVAQPLPLELRTALFFPAPPDTSVYGSGETGLVPVAPAGTDVVDATRGAGHVAFVFSTKQGYVLSVDGVALATSSRRMRGLSLSPDGARIAVAMQRTGMLSSTKSSDWHAVAYTIATRKSTDIGVGFSPYFIGDAHLLTFGPDGLTFIDLGTGSKIIEANSPFVSTQTQTYLSPDRKTLGWTTTDGKTLVFQITHISPPKLTLGQRALVTKGITFGNGAFYQLVQEGNHTDIWKRSNPSDAPVKIYAFPAGMTISRIAF